jgi:hypothetical protein
MSFAVFQITVAYSNALLVAVMPHVTDFAKKLDLPVAQPITIAQVERFNCFPRSDHIGGRLILTNGCSFIFDHGRVESFESADTFAYLQEPRLVPKFYGPIKITEAQALQIAHGAIKKLGYTDEMLAANQRPEIKPPKKDRGHLIARYNFRWIDPTRGGDTNHPPPSIEFEINATTGEIQMVTIFNPNTFRPDPKLNVKPVIAGEGPKTMPAGEGRKITPVSAKYAKEFMSAILPQVSAFVQKMGLAVKTPIVAQDVDMTQYLAKYNCGIVDGDTMAQIDLKKGDRFVYRHGQVIAFYTSDAQDFPMQEHPATYPQIDQYQAKFFGPINMTTNQAVALVRQTLGKLGYAPAVLHVDQPPRVYGPGWWGTNRTARCFMVWSETVDPPTWVNAEVDVAKKTLKSLYINDHAITSIWRIPPKINAQP